MRGTGESYVYVFLVRFFPEGEDVPDDAVVPKLDEELDGVVLAGRAVATQPPAWCAREPRPAARIERSQDHKLHVWASDPLLVGAGLCRACEKRALHVVAWRVR